MDPTGRVKRVDEPLNRLRFLSGEEEQPLLKECDEPLRTIVLLGIYAGLRITAEALTLKKKNVDLGRQLLTIEAAYSKNLETQTIPLHSKLVEPLRAGMEATQGKFLFARGDGTPIRSDQALITDPERATQQALDLVLRGRVQALNGSEVKIHADTLCVHGDNPNAVVLLTRVRNKLREEGVEILPLGRRP